MIAWSCVSCGCEYLGVSVSCPVCKPIRIHAKQCHRVCESNQCGHHGTRDGCTGCLLLPRPSRIWNRLLAGGGCLAKEPLFGPFEDKPQSPVKVISQLSAAEMREIASPPSFAKGSMDGHMVAVTSLSELPHHQSRQAECIASWQRFGLTVHSVNTTDEIQRMKSVYPGVDHWHTSDEVTHDLGSYARPTQMIYSIFAVAIKIDTPILIINSDIEIIGQQATILDRIKANTLVVGIRYNHGRNHSRAIREQWGIDVFLITPEMAKTLPRLPLSIGRPVWDYWIPYHYRREGYVMDFIGSPLFYHLKHSLNWSQEDWLRGRQWINDHYGENEDFAVPFRQSFPFPPPPDTSV